LRSIREHKRAQIGAICQEKPSGLLAREWRIFEREDVIDAWIASILRINELGLVVPDADLERRLHETETVIFEGAQGVLLDAEAGFHPYTTWSRCTAANALELIKEAVPDAQVCRIGVMRSYAVRHGPGPLPTETDAFVSVISEHNQTNEWQGAVRYGWFDAVLARYALEVNGGVDALAVTHLDVLPRLKHWNYCPGYQGGQSLKGLTVDSAISEVILERFHLPPFLSLAQRAEFTQALGAVQPILETCANIERAVIGKIESLIGQPVSIISRGPGAGDVRVINSFPA
jgi:adenylosuccinate synthase